MNDTVQTIVRSVLKVGGGYLLAKGLTDAAGVEAIIGGVMAGIGVVAGLFKSKKTEQLK